MCRHCFRFALQSVAHVLNNPICYTSYSVTFMCFYTSPMVPHPGLHVFSSACIRSVGLAAQDPNVQCWGSEAEDSGDPPRLWAPHALYPGTAFTRSIGDSGAASRRPGRRIFGCRPISHQHSAIILLSVPPSNSVQPGLDRFVNQRWPEQPTRVLVRLLL